MKNRAQLARVYGIALAAWLFSFVLALRWGASPDADPTLIAQLRLPRAILASAVGMGLSVAGAALQALFANPLCDPYTLGVSSGAALGAVVGASLGISWMVAGLAGSAFLGSALFSLILYFISRNSRQSNLALLLSGVMLGFLGSSLVSLWMAFSDPNGIQGALFWLLGDLSRARLQGAILTWVGAAGLVFAIWARSRELDALLMGVEGALALGVPVAQVRRGLILLISFLVALCVSASGMIGFIGLVVPHFARNFAGSLHRKLLPLVAILGASALTAADAAARMVARPYELPVGVMTALIGSPLFLWVILKKARALIEEGVA